MPPKDSKVLGKLHLSKSKAGVKITIDIMDLEQEEGFKGHDGREYITLSASSKNVQDVLNGKIEATPLIFFINE